MDKKQSQRILYASLNTAYQLWHGVRKPSNGHDSHHFALWSRRILALIIDGSIYTLLALFGFFAITSPLIIKSGSHPHGVVEEAVAIAAIILCLIAPLLLLSPWLLARHGRRNGQTPGKRLMGLRVVRDDGREWIFATAFWRQCILKLGLGLGVPIFLAAAGFALASTHAEPATVFYIFFEVLSVIWLLVFALWPLCDKEGRGLHDKLSHSHVRFVPHHKIGA